MRAARYYGKQNLQIEQIAEPRCGAGQVKIAPAFCGICGTDVHEWNGEPTFAPSKAPNPLTKETAPVGFGHEFSGTVKEIGPEVHGLKVGQNVACKPSLQCYSCRACREGFSSACEVAGFIGLSGGGGGLSEAVTVPQHMVFPLPDNVPLELGALVEPLAVAWHAVSVSGMMPGDKVLVLGGGPIGLAVLQICKARKVGSVVLAEVAPARQMFARQFDADYVINPLQDDVPSKTREYFGEAPDVVFECAGVPNSISSAIQAIKSRGNIVNVALWENEASVRLNNLVLKEARLCGALAYEKEDFDFVIEALRSGALKPTGMITKRIRLEDVVEEGIKTLLKSKDDHVKIMVDIGL